VLPLLEATTCGGRLGSTVVVNAERALAPR